MGEPASAVPRFWRLDDMTDSHGASVRPDTEWQIGGVYQHLMHDDGRPPMYGGWYGPTHDFVRLVWTEVPDPRQNAEPCKHERGFPMVDGTCSACGPATHQKAEEQR